jgi:amino acid adenylation domain-containing protein
MSYKQSLTAPRDRNGEAPSRGSEAGRGWARTVCHALRIRLRDRNEIARVESCFADVTNRWFGTSDEPGRRSLPRLWTERLPLGADAVASQRRRASELEWALEPGEVSDLRATLLLFDGGDAELILVARRTALDRKSLRQMACTLVEGDVRAETSTDGTTVVASKSKSILEALRQCTFAPELDWGRERASPSIGNDHHMGNLLPGRFDPALLLSSIGLVLSRFDDQAVPAIGMIAEAEHGGRGDGVEQFGVRLLPIGPGVAATTIAFFDLIKERLSSQAVYDTPKTRQALSSDPGFRCDVAVGLVWDVELAWPAQREVEYRAFLAPPFPLTIAPVAMASGQIRLSYRFERAGFDAGMVQSFGGAVEAAYASLQRALAAGGQAPLAAIEHMSAAQAATVAAQGRSAAPEQLDGNVRIEQHIANLAVQHPGSAAQSYDGRCMSYGELDQRAGQMAAAMRCLGVREGDRVGVCLERSLELVPALLAVLKAGATYVPLDPAYPAERLSFMISDASPSLVISTTPDLSATVDVPVVSPERLVELAAQTDASEPLHRAGPDDAAYIIYTSGSTGRPKGVVVPHRNVMALVAATRNDFALCGTDVWTLFHSTAFDFSVWEIWGCLATGGHLVVVPYWTTRSPDEFVQLLVGQRVTVLNQTPSAFAQLQDAELRASDKLALRLVILGGEALDSRMLLRWLDRHPESKCRLVNMFGVTETTVHVTAETITRRHALSDSRMVGRAIPGWQVYVMDSQRRMLPVGVAGEIYVGGAGVASHYLNRDQMTAERFLVDPYFGGRMYRSGDRGRLRADGRVEHLGRLDSQVKIRGFRIELDEIRSVLLECPGVTAVAVAVNQNAAGDPASARIDAYVVLKAGTVASVRQRVVRILPEHMVPTTVTALAKLPLTANGKLDATRLSPPAFTALAPFAAPSTAAATEASRDGSRASKTSEQGHETALQRIWSNVLGVDVGVDDNFFDVGGNSLYAVRIAAMMRESRIGNMPIRELYVRQTIRGVARYILDLSA